jgi:hypothetical protein
MPVHLGSSFALPLSSPSSLVSASFLSPGCCAVAAWLLSWSSAFSIMPLVYTRLVLGSTSLPATMSMTSFLVRSSSALRSFSPTCSSPFSRMSIIMASSGFLGKAFSRSALGATWPLETLRKTFSICRTLERSVSMRLRYSRTLFL